MEEKMTKNRATFNLVCYLKKSNVLKNGEVPVYMRITVNKQAVFLSMQGSILPSLWSQAKEKSKGKDTRVISRQSHIYRQDDMYNCNTFTKY